MRFILTLSCPDRAGIVASVSDFVFRAGLNIEESQQFGDTTSKKFFLRMELSSKKSATTLAKLQTGFAPIAKKFRMQAQIFDAAQKPRAAILLSKFDHCLVDILHRVRTGRLAMEVAAIVSNHTLAQTIAEQQNIPFHHLPVSAKTKTQAEAALHRLCNSAKIDVIVLARYMQVLSANFVKKWEGQIINIHHSFLPSFQGAEPYSQAFRRGVKMIGATAHYVTAKLDAGPIIEQDVVSVRHDMNPQAMTQMGWEIEQRVLARALRWHCAQRILLNNGKTVIFA